MLKTKSCREQKKVAFLEGQILLVEFAKLIGSFGACSDLS